MSDEVRYKSVLFEFDQITPLPKYAKFILFGNLSYTSSSSQPIIPDSSIPYDLSLDQSSTNTGITLKAVDNSRLYIYEFFRKSCNADRYMHLLKEFIVTLTKDLTVVHMLYEKPIDSTSFRSKQVLFQVEGIIRGLHESESNLQKARLESIASSSWNAAVFDSEIKKQYSNKKDIAKHSLIKQYPWLAHFGDSLKADNDGYESFGLMLGWFLQNHDKLDRPYVRGDDFYGGIAGILLFNLTAKDLCQQFKEQGFSAEWSMFNPKLSTYSNISKAAYKYGVHLVQIEDYHVALMLAIEANMKLPEDFKCITLALITPNYIDRALKDVLGSNYHIVF